MLVGLHVSTIPESSSGPQVTDPWPDDDSGRVETCSPTKG
jgi:hypothetical protein